MRTDAFDYVLPPDLIAQEPVEPRDQARLMVLRRHRPEREHHRFADLPRLLRPGDLLVRNATRVIPARLLGQRQATSGRWEGLYLNSQPDGSWLLLCQARGRLQPGEWVVLEGGLRLNLLGRRTDGTWLARPESAEPAQLLLDRFGQVPIPPYIRKGHPGPGDRERYQTVYAERPGSVAAPTAGLHFTPEVFRALTERGIGWVDVVLHVGIGTFRPILSEEIEQHTLHEEWAELTPEVADRLNACRSSGGRIVAVGTTSARLLETASQEGRFAPFVGETGLYIRPGHRFRGFDALITNFHLPRSSLLVLVSAFAGIEVTRAGYDEAIARRYRFYSYGDAMLVLPSSDPEKPADVSLSDSPGLV